MATTTCTITISMYSGRPSPSFGLTPEKSATLLAILGKAVEAPPPPKKPRYWFPLFEFYAYFTNGNVNISYIIFYDEIEIEREKKFYIDANFEAYNFILQNMPDDIRHEYLSLKKYTEDFRSRLDCRPKTNQDSAPE